VLGYSESHHDEEPNREVKETVACFLGSDSCIQRVHDLFPRFAALDILDEASNSVRASRPSMLTFCVRCKNVPLASVIVAICLVTKFVEPIAVEKFVRARG
jgi:hypothetical protein